MKRLLLIFGLLNFGALAISSIYTNPWVVSDWYTGLNQAPWTPPGWVFGFAWTTIMICFSVYMARAWLVISPKNVLISLFSVQWILNTVWNPVFFTLHETTVALALIGSLTVLMIGILIRYWSVVGIYKYLLLPYCIWLLIATSLNGYVVFMN